MAIIEFSVQTDEERAHLDQLANEKGVINAGTTRTDLPPISLEVSPDATKFSGFSISRVENFFAVDQPKKTGMLRRLLHR